MAIIRDSQVIKESRDVKITFDGKMAKLHISSSTVEASGTYKCQIINEYGREESSAELTIKKEGN